MRNASGQQRKVKMSGSEKQVKKKTYVHGVGDLGLVGLVSFVFRLQGTQNKRKLPH